MQHVNRYICLPHFCVIWYHYIVRLYTFQKYTYVHIHSICPRSFTLLGNLKDTVFTWKRPEYPDSKRIFFGVQSPERRRSMGSTMPRHHWCPVEGSLQDSAKSTTTWHLCEHRNSVWLVIFSWSCLQMFIRDMITVATMCFLVDNTKASSLFPWENGRKLLSQRPRLFWSST